MHQFFLTDRSLFLLVWSARIGYEQSKLYYWLDIIKSRAPKSRVLIVATHSQDSKLGDVRLPEQHLRDKYPQMNIQYCAIDNKTGEGIESLWGEINKAAAQLQLMGESWPINWLSASMAITSRRKLEHWITAREFLRMMAQHNVTNDDLHVLARLLHDLGEILYYQDNENLNEIVILDAPWVTRAIYQVLTSSTVIANNGVLTRAHMEALWHSIEPSLRDHLLCLMEQFDLSYSALVDNKKVSLIVEALPLDPPPYEAVWNAIKARGTSNEVSMKFQLEGTMPPGIPTWFIARSYRFSTGTHWRYGALLADGPERRHLGLIQTFPQGKDIRLTVRGPQPHNFFALLRDGLEEILARFKGLEIHRSIPCPGHNGQSCNYEFDYDNLERAIEHQPPVNDLQCQVTFNFVSVPRLLFGLSWSTQNAVLNAIKDLEASNREQQAELLALLQREFTKQFRQEQARQESHCPNVFVLRPKDVPSWKKGFLEKMELQLYCQMPGLWHPTGKDGRYTINRPAPWLKAWLKAVSPYLLQIAKVLKYSLPLVRPIVGSAAVSVYEEIRSDIGLVNELVEWLPEVVDAPEMQSVEILDRPIQPARMKGAELRTLRKLLEDLDPKEYWGGLEKLLTPEGHYLWLCKEHIAEYKQEKGLAGS